MSLYSHILIFCDVSFTWLCCVIIFVSPCLNSCFITSSINKFLIACLHGVVWASAFFPFVSSPCMFLGSNNFCTVWVQQFGQVGVGDNVDHCSPVQVRIPHEEAWAYFSDFLCFIRILEVLIFLTSISFVFFFLQKIVQISCGWRHTLALTDRQNVFSWGRGTSGQLGHGDILDR